MNLFEQCSGQTLSSNLQWLNEPAEWFIQDGVVTITVPPVSDFFIDPAGAVVKASAPYLHTVIKGDFSIVARVEVDMREQYDSGCLMIMADDVHWAKVCFEFFEGQPSILSVVTRENSDDCVSSPVDVNRPYLRIARAGNSFAFHYSQDGEKWKLVRYFGMDCPDEIKVGIVAQSPVGQGSRSTFTEVQLQYGVDTDIRNVK